MIKWTNFMLFFRIICLTTTAFMIGYWLYKFNLNEDLCLVEYKPFYKTEEDVCPLLSVCFKNPFNKEVLVHQGVNESLYLKFLNGVYFDRHIVDIDYDNVTLKMSDYVMAYWNL